MTLERRYRSVHHVATTVWSAVALAWESYAWGLTCLMLLEIVQGLMPLAMAWIMKTLFDLLGQALQAGGSAGLPAVLLWLLAAQVLLTIVSQLITPLSTFVTSELGRRVTLLTQTRIYSKINGLVGLAPFESPRFHDTIKLATQGALFGPQQLVPMLAQMVRGAVTVASFIGVLLAFSPFLAAGVAVAMLPELYVQLKLGAQRFVLSHDLSPKDRLGFYYSNVLSSLSFAKSLRLYGMADYFLRAFRQVTGEIHGAKRNQSKREAGWRAGLSTLSGLVGSAVFVLVVLAAFSGSLSLGDVALFTGAVGSLQGALATIVMAVATMNESALFFSRYNDVMALPESISIVSEPRSIAPLEKSIELRGVSFRYSEDHPWVLRDLNLTIPVGKCVALVGLNGSGKSTLVKLLTRLYDPNEGQVLWDGIDVREFDPWQLRRRMGAVFQDFARFDLSAHANIGLGDVTAMEDDERVRQAADKASIHSVIEGLPRGYQTLLSRQLSGNGVGVDLSGGEWQRLALARLFMRDADVVILDEPTAALDAQAEYQVYNRFVSLVAGRASLLISHRFSTTRMADAVAVLQDGQICELGSHDELMSRQGLYSRLYSMQAERFRMEPTTGEGACHAPLHELAATATAPALRPPAGSAR